MLYIVGIGPGSLDLLTQRAIERISNADVIIGNEKYVEQIKKIIPSRARVIKGQMGDEVERAKLAIELSTRENVVVISGGDAGIYGMAGLIFEVSGGSVPVEVIPGVTAASAVASILGAPISNDFAVISLSDLLIPWSEIENRVEQLAKMDIVVVIYNPSSKTRKLQLERAHRIFLKYRSPKSIVGIVRNAEREDSEVNITTLDKMLSYRIDMSTTIIIGSSSTKLIGNRMVTPRGYHRKYDYEKSYNHYENRIQNASNIAQESREVVQSILHNSIIASKLTALERRVAERVIIANADPTLLDFLVFKNNPVDRGIECIKNGKAIITDIEMVKTGIKKEGLKSQVLCFLKSEEARAISSREGITISAAGIRIARGYLDGNIAIIGNSPTACLELYRIIQSGVEPALVIATPVGFINAAEAKEKILSLDIPCIVIKGPRGGTPSAVAIINEIIQLSETQFID
ncbi:MAG: precorrin-3B C(17)-methyltransferase [Methanocellales archaeon]